MIDLRSDTLTCPTEGMKHAMHEAELGDDVYGEDPTINRLEDQVAELFAKPAALFVPSGTMANQLAIGCHAGPGDEVICANDAHVYVWEAGGIARLWGATPRTFPGDRGILRLADLHECIRPDNMHYTRSRLLCLENTHNRGGGRVYPWEDLLAVTGWARSHGLATHCDGARLMNAVVASQRSAAQWAEPFDSLTLCFSKGLGAPVGSALIGSHDLIARARSLRKALGGGMRQAGSLAAAAIYALDHHVDRLAEDHHHAQILAQAIRETPGLTLEFDPVETNLVWFEVDPELGTGTEVVGRLQDQGVRVSALGPQNLRACTHLDVSTEQVEQAASALRSLSAVGVA